MHSSARNIPGQKNRGIKKAPFVVLIGASMPSVLAEIGFLSNPREESLLKKSDYRQKLAESLYRGISKYAEGLSHFQLAAELTRMRVLVFRHVPFEDLGLIAPVLAARAHCVRLRRSLPGRRRDAGYRAYDALIFLGGPMSVNDDLPYLRQRNAS